MRKMIFLICKTFLSDIPYDLNLYTVNKFVKTMILTVLL